MKLTAHFAAMTPDKRPQDPHLDGTGLRFETMEHGGEYPDAMPQAIKLIDAEGRSCIYVPITQNGKVVDSQGFVLDRRMNDRQAGRLFAPLRSERTKIPKPGGKGGDMTLMRVGC
jgi:hypothetical protein